MRILVIESERNREIVEFLENTNKYVIQNDITMLSECNIVIVGLVQNIREALDIIEIALQYGIEIICIKQKFCKESYVCNLLIKEGALYI